MSSWDRDAHAALREVGESSSSLNPFAADDPPPPSSGLFSDSLGGGGGPPRGRTNTSVDDLVRLAAAAQDEVWEALGTDLVAGLNGGNVDSELTVLALAEAEGDDEVEEEEETDPQHHRLHMADVSLLEEVIPDARHLGAAHALAEIADRHPALDQALQKSAVAQRAALGAGPEGAADAPRVSVFERLAEYQDGDLLVPNGGETPLLAGSESSPLLGAGGGDDPDGGDMSGHHAHPPEHRIGILKSTFNLLNDNVGAAIVSVPYYITSPGFSAGMGLMFGFASISFCTLMLLHYITVKRGVLTFSEMCFLAFGRGGVIVSAVLIFLFNFGALAGNLLLLGKLLSGLLGSLAALLLGAESPWWLNWRLMIVCSVLVLGGLAYYKTLDRFANISMLCIFATVFLVATVTYTSIATPPTDSGLSLFEGSPMSWIAFLQSLGGISYLFTCHDLSFHVVHTLRHPTTFRFALVAGSSVFVTFLAFTVMATCAQLTYGRATTDDVLDNVSAQPNVQVISTLCKVAMCLNISIGIPYCCYMPRVALLSLLQLIRPDWVLPGKVDNSNFGRVEDDNRRRHLVHIAVTTFVLVLGLACALSGLPLGTFFGLSGGLAGVAISVVIPVAVWLRLRSVSNVEKQIALTTTQREPPPWTVAAVVAEVDKRPELMSDTKNSATSVSMTNLAEKTPHFTQLSNAVKLFVAWGAIVVGILAASACVYSYVGMSLH
jgi:amino acid permease